MDEIWKDIPEFIGTYQASNKGRIRCIATHNGSGKRKAIGNIIPEFVSIRGYSMVAITKSKRVQVKRYVHRLVISAFVEPCPPRLQVNHKNGVKQDNQPDNLEYVTASENHYHSYGVLGKQAARGEKQGSSRLTEEQVIRIRELHASNQFTGEQLAEMFHVSTSNISMIISRKRWAHL